MKRAERLHAVTESLRRAGERGRTAQQLAAEFEVTTRTVKRDLAALAASGVPVWGRTGPGGGYGLLAGTLPPVNVTAAQAMALNAAVTMARNAPFADSARAATRKVLDALAPPDRRRAAELSRRIWVDLGPSAPRRVLSVLEQALIEQHVVRLEYVDAAGRETRREVEPMIFAHRRGRWFLVAWCRRRDGVRWFDLVRVRGAAATRRPCCGHGIDEIGAPPQTARPAVNQGHGEPSQDDGPRSD